MVTGPEGFRRLRLPESPDNQHIKVVPAAFIPGRYPWYSLLSKAESTPGPYCGRKD